jgi:hypothetical protein
MPRPIVSKVDRIWVGDGIARQEVTLVKVIIGLLLSIARLPINSKQIQIAGLINDDTMVAHAVPIDISPRRQKLQESWDDCSQQCPSDGEGSFG